MRPPATFPVPDILVRNGLNCYLDGIRGYLVHATPEEAVRQQTVLWLKHSLRVPHHLIRTEFNHRRHGGYGRSDILVLHPSGNAQRASLVVECKRPGFPLEERARHQVTRYASQVAASFCALTNGDEVAAFHRAPRTRDWRQIEVPRWSELLSGDVRFAPPPEAGERWRWSHYGSRLKMKLRLRDSSDILRRVVGADSEWHVGAFACNLYDLLVYERDALPRPVEDERIVLLQDLGIHDRYFGNAAGGSWPSDEYRSFLVLDKHRSAHQVVSLLVSSSLKTKNHPVFKNSPGRTYLVVAVDEGQRSHLSLQACLDNTITEGDVLGGKVTLLHNAALTTGRRGSVARRKVLEFISKSAPHLVRDGRVLLGTLPSDRHILWKDASDCLLRTVRYALVRDELRQALA